MKNIKEEEFKVFLDNLTDILSDYNSLANCRLKIYSSVVEKVKEYQNNLKPVQESKWRQLKITYDSSSTQI